MRTKTILWSKPRGSGEAWEMRGRGAGGREYVVTRVMQPSHRPLRSGGWWLYRASLGGRSVVSPNLHFPDAACNRTSVADVKNAVAEEERGFVLEGSQAAAEGAGDD